MDSRKQELLEARFLGPSYGGSGSGGASAGGNIGSADAVAVGRNGLSQSSSGQSANLDVTSNPSTADFSTLVKDASSSVADGCGVPITMATDCMAAGDEAANSHSQSNEPHPAASASAVLAAAATTAAAATVSSPRAWLSSVTTLTDSTTASGRSATAPKPRKRRVAGTDDSPQLPRTPGGGGRCRRIDEFYTKPNPPTMPPHQPPSSLPLLTPQMPLSTPQMPLSTPQMPLPTPQMSLPFPTPQLPLPQPYFVVSDESNSSRSSDGATASATGSRRPAGGRQRKKASAAPAVRERLSPVKERQCSPDASWLLPPPLPLPPAAPAPAADVRAELAALVKARDEFALQSAAQQRQIELLKECQDRGRETLRALLAEKSRAEKREVRKRCRANRLRLGQFHLVRQGPDLREKWFDGCAFDEVHRRRQEIEQVKERIEKERRLWNKRKPGQAGTAAKAVGSRGAATFAAAKLPVPGIVASASTGFAAGGCSVDLDADEFFTQLEIYDIQRQQLIKDEKDLRDEIEKLDRERNVHIREMRRIQNEDSSRFQDNLELNSRYMLLCLLGKGGFSEVHKAYDMTEHRFVACKIHQLNASWPKEKKDSYIRHAVREIEIHKTLHHPRIVKVYDVFDIDSDSFCTVLEYSKGSDLDFYLKQNKSMPEREARNIICQVVSALKYLNQRKPPVIHYDLKPGNILLGEGDSIAAIKLTDFGLSKVMTEDKFHPDSGMDLTNPGAGTYWYLPPECFEGAPKISSKVDVWSVGVIFYQCLYGQKPFGHNLTQENILRDHTILKASRVDFPQSAPGNCKVSEQAKNFIRRCVTHDKHLRPDVLQLTEDEYLKSKAQLKFDTTTAALSPATAAPTA